jgi:hypothetical protein
MRLFYQIVSCLILLTRVAWPQSENAVVTFTIDFPSSQPEHYSIRVEADGASHYQSSGRLSADSDEADSFDYDFKMSGETRAKVFELAAKANYFDKDVDSHHKGLAFTGKKTLTFRDASRHGEATYNYSSNPSVQALTALMQSLSTTMESGHRLQYDHQYQKLALEEELKRMEGMAHASELPEIAALQPVLQKIVDDPTVMNVSRARAQRLLEGAGRR